MKAKTKELLYLLLWASEMAGRPTFRNLTESFEGWAYRGGLGKQLAHLERQKLLESNENDKGERLHRLTATGREVALGHRDPIAQWKRDWDGKWRMVLFDVPQSQASTRARLRRSLAARSFGYLQDSVWITPDPLSQESQLLGRDPINVESLILLEASACAGESNQQIVAGAWDFEAINEAYAFHQSVLERMPDKPAGDQIGACLWRDWFREEQASWTQVMRLDPLLPEQLHPRGYAGVSSWKRRLKFMKSASRQLRSFQRCP